MRKGRLRENLDIIIVTSIISMIGSLSLGYANTILYAGNEVSYDNSVSGLNSVTVQGALDELCTAADFSDRVSTLEGKTTTLEGYFENNPTSKFSSNGIALGKANTSTTGNTYIDFWYNNKMTANIYSGPNTNGSGLTISANNASGTGGQGNLSLYGNPINLNSSGTSSATNIYGNPVKINGTDMSTKNTITVTPTVGSGYIRVYSVGNVAMLKFINYNPGAITTRTTVGNIPAGYRPPEEVTIVVQGGYNGAIGVKANGDIWFDPALASRGWYTTGTYVKWQ